jgi:chaperone BCS1
MLTAIWNFIYAQVANNQFLTGGLVVGSIGFLIAYLKSLPATIWAWFKRRVIIELDIPDRDESFKWLDVWLAQHNYQKRCRLLTVHTSRRKLEKYETATAAPGIEDQRARPEISLSPAPGTHYFFYRRRLVILRRERKDGADTKNSTALGFRETFNIKILSRNRHLVLDLLEEARELAHPRSDDRLSVYVPRYDDWIRSTRKMPRPFDSVIMAGNLSETLLADIQEFQQSRDWYNALGIPYRRGYLFCGLPGNGKSSLVMALASKLQLDICVLNLSATGLSDERLGELMSDVPEGAVLLLEDIDCVFVNREKKDDKDTVTFSGLLNSIDGVMAGEGRILFMTTNYVDRLDAALIRPGRCDVQLEIGNATEDQIKRLFLRFYPASEDLADKFVALIPSETISMATLQGHFLKYRKNAQEALDKFQP